MQTKHYVDTSGTPQTGAFVKSGINVLQDYRKQKQNSSVFFKKKAKEFNVFCKARQVICKGNLQTTLTCDMPSFAAFIYLETSSLMPEEQGAQSAIFWRFKELRAPGSAAFSPEVLPVKSDINVANLPFCTSLRKLVPQGKSAMASGWRNFGTVRSGAVFSRKDYVTCKYAKGNQNYGKYGAMKFRNFSSSTPPETGKQPTSNKVEKEENSENEPSIGEMMDRFNQLNKELYELESKLEYLSVSDKEGDEIEVAIDLLKIEITKQRALIDLRNRRDYVPFREKLKRFLKRVRDFFRRSSPPSSSSGSSSKASQDLKSSAKEKSSKTASFVIPYAVFTTGSQSDIFLSFVLESSFPLPISFPDITILAVDQAFVTALAILYIYLLGQAAVIASRPPKKPRKRKKQKKTEEEPAPEDAAQPKAEPQNEVNTPKEEWQAEPSSRVAQKAEHLREVEKRAAEEVAQSLERARVREAARRAGEQRRATERAIRQQAGLED